VAKLQEEMGTASLPSLHFFSCEAEKSVRTDSSGENTSYSHTVYTGQPHKRPEALFKPVHLPLKH